MKKGIMLRRIQIFSGPNLRIAQSERKKNRLVMQHPVTNKGLRIFAPVELLVLIIYLFIVIIILENR